ncbi:MAG: hypothetical protein MUP21_04645 [Dehalococcoidia bacterium]|nr:hypothetical protein [Dehalococcoidia bacterium]
MTTIMIIWIKIVVIITVGNKHQRIPAICKKANELIQSVTKHRQILTMTDVL